MIRYMASLGQSSDPQLPSYNASGIPLENGVVELITANSVQPGQRHASIWDVRYGSFQDGANYVGQIAVYSWPGEHPNNAPAPSIATHKSDVVWMLGKDWLPFQRKTFNTPAFPGYISGHSTFSRAAAEALTLLTGSPYFPGGFGHHVYPANSMQIDLGPSTPVDLQWASYYDAADQAGQSRRWGGIHPSEDDFHGRYIASQVGKSAFALAAAYWDGSVLEENVQPRIAIESGGIVRITSATRRGLRYQWEYSTDLVNWIPIGSVFQATGSSASTTDTPPAGQQRFYRAGWVAAQ
jgi:hypothetical protein